MRLSAALLLLSATRAAEFEVTLGQDVHDISAPSVDVSRMQAESVLRSAGACAQAACS